MGSVKDLKIIEKPTETKLGQGVWTFSDRYSVFDWGEMPDRIPNKGAALCTMASWNFEQLEEMGIKTHYVGVMQDGKIVKTDKLKAPSNKMVIQLSRVIEPEFVDGRNDYEFFMSNRGKINNYVIPLENIYRRGTPEGSSLLKKISELAKKGDKKNLKLLFKKYGLKKAPKPGDIFPRPGYDFTTKFEQSDRPLSDEQAYEISGLTKKQFDALKETRDQVSTFVARRAEEVGLTDFDGKHEYIFIDGICVADVVGTFDENRFVFKGAQISKEILRQYYKKHQAEWVEEVEQAKKDARSKGIENWKTLVKSKPKKIDPKLAKLVSEMYASGADLYTEMNIFKTRPLEDVMKDLKKELK
ncbi:phosphoribosylaminoimidazolesuccinocarboxamide synthase [Elusimicrobiota bacterium]